MSYLPEDGELSAAFPALCGPDQGDTFRERLSDTTLLLTFLLLPITAGILVAAPEIVRVAYGRGAFDAEAVARTTQLLRILSLGLPCMAVQQLMLRALLAQSRATGLSRLTSAVLALHLLASAVVLAYGVGALAIVHSAAQLILAAGTLALLPSACRPVPATYGMMGRTLLLAGGFGLAALAVWSLLLHRVSIPLLYFLPAAGVLFSIYVAACGAVGHPVARAWVSGLKRLTVNRTPSRSDPPGQ